MTEADVLQLVSAFGFVMRNTTRGQLEMAEEINADIKTAQAFDLYQRLKEAI